MSRVEKEFQDFDRRQIWPIVFQKVKNEAAVKSIEEQHSVGEARKPENRPKNRYRDVSPYDHSRVILQKGESDYINASVVEVPECNRRYILSQGPLEHTAADFWQMVWEQNSKAVIMLNRVIEKETRKCHQYWPLGEDADEEMMTFEEVGLRVRLLEQQQSRHYVVRSIELLDLESEESRIVFHFHYITWPDFGVPSSPLEFLDFLDRVRSQGVLENDVGPAIVHCSAGIGRSGTFCLVDTALILVEKSRSLDIDVLSLLLSMRTFRMGLIQTPEQLRFSYMAIIAGAHMILLGDEEEDQQDEESAEGAQSVLDVVENYMDMTGAKSTEEDVPPPPPCRTTSLSDRKRPPSPPPRTTSKLSPVEEPAGKQSKLESTDIPPKPARMPAQTVKQSQDDVQNSDLAPENKVVAQNPVTVAETTVTRLGYTQVPNKETLVDNKDVMIKNTAELGDKKETQVEEAKELDGSHGVLDKEAIAKGAASVLEKELSIENNNPVLMSKPEMEGTDEVIADDADAGAVFDEGNAVAGAERNHASSDAQLRRRMREERKKSTQELIKSMKEKQRQSETWKKRKTYLKPIALGLSILIGGYLLYKFYW